MTQTEKLKKEVAEFIGQMPLKQKPTDSWCEFTSRQILLLGKEAGLMFTRTGVVGDDLEGACICKVEEIEIG